MPLPLTILPTVSQTESKISTSSIEKTLVDANIIPANTTAVEILNSCGASMEQTVVNLANMAMTARDNVRHAVLKDILDLHGVKFRQEVEANTKPTITFNISAENVQANLSSMFDPERQS